MCLSLLGVTPAAFAQGGQETNSGYQRPPETMAAIIEAPATPSVRISAKGDWMLLLESPGYPSIEEVSALENRIAGLRINPATNGRATAATIQT
ncbi:hypothetical protein [Pontibacter harenae]|uniref:hypothetical protein n=1 Tax=Pontibacter harenae TaxID=2894083 RepID=UPI001E57E946|nr:hypothetical protein [Pontibacter harenae]MCC9168579.1 hypothetical protein [Pontibacter harenae]